VSWDRSAHQPTMPAKQGVRVPWLQRRQRNLAGSCLVLQGHPSPRTNSSTSAPVGFPSGPLWPVEGARPHCRVGAPQRVKPFGPSSFFDRVTGTPLKPHRRRCRRRAYTGVRRQRGQSSTRPAAGRRARAPGDGRACALGPAAEEDCGALRARRPGTSLCCPVRFAAGCDFIGAQQYQRGARE
jgi:hypothetical protein